MDFTGNQSELNTLNYLIFVKMVMARENSNTKIQIIFQRANCGENTGFVVNILKSLGYREKWRW